MVPTVKRNFIRKIYIPYKTTSDNKLEKNIFFIKKIETKQFVKENKSVQRTHQQQESKENFSTFHIHNILTILTNMNTTEIYINNFQFTIDDMYPFEEHLMVTKGVTTYIERLTGTGDANMSFTPAMSQVLVAPTTPTGPISAVDNITEEEFNSFYFYETEQFTVLWVLFTVIVVGNSAVLVTLFLNKNRKSRMNFFIKQLAIADLCVGLLNVLTDIIWRITVSWRAGNIACKVIRFLQACVTYASTYVLVALSIDRYDAITHPMNFSGSWRRARRLVAAAWALSAIFSLPMIFLYEEKLIQEQTQCWIELGEPWRWQLYMSLVASALFAVPALIISACYAIIVRTIWAKGAILGPSDRGRGGIDRGSRRASSRGIIPRAKVKTVKMTIVIVIVFVVCWSPYIVFDLLQVFDRIPKTQTNIAIATFIQSLAPLNSAANPLIYCMFSTQVCRALRRLPPFRWLVSTWCCKDVDNGAVSRSCTTTTTQAGRHHHHHHHHHNNHNNSSDSMRTLTTSLTVSRRSTNSCIRPARVVIVERPKTILAMSEV